MRPARIPIYGSSNLGLDGDAVGRFGLMQFTPLLEAWVLVPSDMIAIGDYRDVPGGQDGDIAGALDEPDDYVGDRHNQGGNVVFCDAHVEYGKQANWMRATESARQPWNNDHSPQPETWH